MDRLRTRCAPAARLFTRIPLSVYALLLVLGPMLFDLAQHWYQLPLPYGQFFGPADPDPWVRLTLVRDWLTGGEWYSHAVAQSDTPFGHTISPWTRPLDVVIALFVKLQPADVDLSLRLMRAALVMPVLWMSLLLLGLIRAARKVSPLPATSLMVSALLVSSTILWNYFGTGNSDHHSMLSVVFIWALGGLLAPAPSRRVTLLSGLLFGLLVWISPEGLVLIAAVLGWYGLLWIAGEDDAAKPLPLLASSIALASAVAVMIERPPAHWLLPIYDSISIVYVVILATAALLCHALLRFGPRTTWLRLVSALLSLGGVVSVIFWLYPPMLHGPLVEADPYIFTNFLPRIIEAQPLWTEPWLYMVAMLLQPLAALAMVVYSARQKTPLFAGLSGFKLGYLLCITSALYLTQQRFYYYNQPVVILVLAPFLAALLTPEPEAIRHRWPAQWLNRLSLQRQALYRLPAIALVLGLPYLLREEVTYPQTETSQKIDACQRKTRQLIYGGKLNDINHGKPLNLLIWTDLGGEVMFFTPHHIVASNYHREGPGIRYVWEADDVTDMAELRRYLARRHIEALLICPVVNPPENSALQRLREGAKLPGWLARIPYPQPPADEDDTPVEGADPVILRVQ